MLAVHPPRVAATRLRVEQHRPGIEAAGLPTRSWSFFADADLADWYGPSQRRRALVALRALARVGRVVGVVRGSAVVIVQREALPFGPPLVELLAGWGRRLVWDVDDAIWEPFESPTAGRVPRWLRATGGKYERLCRRADEVWAGSELLASWCRRHSRRVTVIPTVVDVPDERPEPTECRTVGWIGSHSTGAFVEAVLPALVAIDPPVVGVVVGASPAVPPGLEVDVCPWTLDEEKRALARTRVGLYPIDRSHPLADGKCGLKAILFMAHGVPPVVTPTPTNAAVVRDGVDGLHADSADEWAAAVERLLDDHDLWERCSRSAYERARSEYSLAVWGPRVAARLVALAGGS